MNIEVDYMCYYTGLYSTNCNRDELIFRNNVIKSIKNNNVDELLKTIFGDNYRLFIPKRNCKNKVSRIILDKFNADSILKSYIPDDVELETTEDKDVFAEYYDKNVYNLDKNLLKVNKNNLSYNKYDLIATMEHELAKGHYLFYKKLYKSVREHNGLFDGSAIATIEGYATYCEWNSKPNEHTRKLKDRAIALLYADIDIKDSKEKIKTIYDMNTDFGYSEELSMSIAKNYVKYPGFTSLYYMGALFFEYLFDSSDSILKELQKYTNLTDSNLLAIRRDIISD